MAWVCHLDGGRGLVAGGPDASVRGVVLLKWEDPRLNEDPLFASACFLKASKSGLASRGTCFGKAAPKLFTDDVEGLHLS